MDSFYSFQNVLTGTTWTQEIMYLALNDGDVEKAKKTHTMLRVPYLEANFQQPKVFTMNMYAEFKSRIKNSYIPSEKQLQHSKQL